MNNDKKPAKSLLAMLFVFVICASFNCVVAQTVSWICTIEKEPWQQQQSPPMVKYDGFDERLITIIPEVQFQVIDGFGGCFNEKGWDALSVLPEEQQQKIMQSLFADNGCRFNLCRMPIGGNDYSMDSYSLNDHTGDYSMEHFSIERDKKYLIPFIKSALAIRPDLLLWGSPWCPPAWMKINEHYACQGMQENSRLKWEPKILSAYATYFSKFIQAYKENGIDIYAIHVQNEPWACQVFPSCLWSGAELRDFIRDYLSPRFRQDKIRTEIWLGTINNGNYQDCAGIVLSDSQVNAAVTGIGYQWAGKFACAETHQRHPDKKLMQTESECGDGANDFAAAEYTFSLIKHYFTAGVNSYLYWNMVLDQTGLSTWGWEQNALIGINRYTLDIDYHPEYFVMKHFSRYIQPGAHRVKTTGADEGALGFVNPDGQLVLVVGNPDQFTKKMAVKIKDDMFQMVLPAHSFNTFLIECKK